MLLWLIQGYDATAERIRVMAPVKRDEKREHRITMEIVVDAYGPEEQAMGWYYYLDDRMQFPFEAVCVVNDELLPSKKVQPPK
jgi:hypothetical protein